MAEFSRLHVQLKRAIPHALDLLNMMADLLEHAPNLPVASFDQRHYIPWIGRLAQQLNSHRARLHGRGPSSLAFVAELSNRNLQRRTFGWKLEPAAQLIDLLVRRFATDFDEIGLRHVR